MPSDNEFLRVQQDVEEAEISRSRHPTGWEPRLIVEGTRAELVSRSAPADGPAPGWEDELRERGGDPTRWRPSGPVRFSSWDAQVKGGAVVQMHAYRWNLVPVDLAAADPDVEATIARIRKHKKRPPTVEIDRPRALVVCLADWQAGKSDGGGVDALIERILALRDAVPAHLAKLRKTGVVIDRLYVVSMGDLVEGCGNDHYAMQDFLLELDGRQQEKLVRRLLVELLTSWSSLAPQVVVGCVPGNHGERRRKGKAYTTFEDNADLAVVEQAAEILTANGDAYGHVRFTIPDGDLTLTLDVAGTVVGFAHGHQAGGAGGPAQKIDRWWGDKAKARHRIGDADVLVTGHYHHLIVVQDGPRTHMQCPANDGGSRWFEERGGSSTVCGTLSFTCDEDGWDHLTVLR